MSGPKTYGYSVDEARLQREREEARRQAELAELRRRFANLQARVAEWQAVYGRDVIADIAMPAGDSAMDLRSALGQGEITLRSAVSSARAAKLEEAFGVTSIELNVEDALVKEEPAAPKKKSTKSNSQIVTELKSHGVEVVARLSAGAEQADAESVDVALTRLKAARSASDAQLHMDSLRERVAKANSNVLLRDESNELIERVRVELAGLDGEAVAQALVVADELESSGRLVDDEVRELFEDAIEAGKALAERRHVAAVMRDALREEKYEVGEDFETILVSGGQIDVHKSISDASWTGYAVRVVSSPEKGELTSYVVRGARIDGGSDEFDKMIEENWCDDHARVVDKASQDGVDLSRIRSKQAGELPLLEVPELVSPERASRRAQAPRERELDL